MIQTASSAQAASSRGARSRSSRLQRADHRHPRGLRPPDVSERPRVRSRRPIPRWRACRRRASPRATRVPISDGSDTVQGMPPRGIRYALAGAAVFFVLVVAIRKLREPEPEPVTVPEVPASAYVRHGEGELDDGRNGRVVVASPAASSVETILPRRRRRPARRRRRRRSVSRHASSMRREGACPAQAPSSM